jgi:prevent-host-death family protein
MSENVPLAELKNKLSEYVERVEREHDRVVITKHGRPAAVVLSIDDLESLEETLAILSDPSIMSDLAQARDDVAAGRVDTFTREQLLATLNEPV